MSRARQVGRKGRDGPAPVQAKIGARFQDETAALASSTRGPKARALETLVRPRDQFRLSRTSGSYSVSIPTVPSGFTGRGPDWTSAPASGTPELPMPDWTRKR